jgi:HD-GYP domain-containing protein (c-di-GMP phosphodiesterase class II)
MPIVLPESLFIQNRIVQTDEGYFRLSKRFRDSMSTGRRSVLKNQLLSAQPSPLLDIPLLVRYLDEVLHHILQLANAKDLIDAFAIKLINRVKGNRDGYLAACLLQKDQKYYTTRHALCCAILATLLSEMQKLSNGETLSLVKAALTMNVGAIELHDELSRDERLQLTSMQQQMIKIHPLVSAAILREIGVEDDDWYQGVLLHHEKRNGRGYPFALDGKAIPLQAHALHAIDMAAAQILPGRNRTRQPIPQALSSLYTSREEPIDFTIASQLIRILGLYPPGSFVELNSGEIALVIRAGANSNAPIVALHHTPPTMLIDSGEEAFRVSRSVGSPLEQPLHDFSRYWVNTPSGAPS